MVSKAVLATIVGGGVVAATVPFYVYEILTNSNPELAVNGAGVLGAAAFVALLAYEDWRDAKRNARNGHRSRS